MAKKSGAIFILALMIVALSVRQRQSIEKQKTHRKVFWHPGLKQSLLLVFTVSSGMLLTGCGQEEYTSLAEAQKGVCISPPCRQCCQECVKLRWDWLVDIDKETIHHGGGSTVLKPMVDRFFVMQMRSKSPALNSWKK